MTYVKRVDQFNAWTVEGIHNFHQIKNIGLDKIYFHVWNLSCFCKLCSKGGDGHCENETYVPPFNFIRLEPCNASNAQANVEPLHQVEIKDQETLVATLEVENHFAIIIEEANFKGSDFWILVCEEPLCVVEEEQKVDNWGQVVFQGEQVVIKRYYKQQEFNLICIV
jgi:hypothetical protein